MLLLLRLLAFALPRALPLELRLFSRALRLLALARLGRLALERHLVLPPLPHPLVLHLALPLRHGAAPQPLVPPSL
eukprot:1891272-Prymnesium_polylepis.1